MSENALQGVIDLVGNARDELAERGELFRLRELRAERFPFDFEPGLSRDVPGDEDRADRLAVLVDERRHRHDEAAAEARMLERAHALGGELGVGARRPVGQVRSDELGELTFEEIRARASQPHGKRIVHLHDAVRAVGDHDQIDQRVERVLEQTPLVPHVLEELDVLDAGRQLPPEISGQIEALRVVQLVGDGAFDDERAEGPAPAAQRRDEDRLRWRAEDLRLLQTEPSGRRLLGVAGGDPLCRGAVGRIG